MYMFFCEVTKVWISFCYYRCTFPPQEEYVKWKGVLFFYYITTLIDENQEIKDLGNISFSIYTSEITILKLSCLST